MTLTGLTASNLISPAPAFRPRSLTRRRRIFSAMLLFVALCALGASASAQNFQQTKNTPDQSLRGDFKVDPSTQALSLQIPLGLYLGRAGTSLPITLYYSSKVWRMNYDKHYDENSSCIAGQALDNDYTTVTPVFADNHSFSGWTTSLDFPYVEWDDQQFQTNGQPCLSCQGTNQGMSVPRLTIHMPDGSAHEFRKNDTPVAGSNPEAAGTYLSVDSTQMRYVAVSSTAGTLYLPDGSRYLLNLPNGAGQPQSSFVDRNGNALDSLGRGITGPPMNNSVETDYPYSLPGIGTTSLTYTLRWKTLEHALTTPQTLRYMGDRLECGQETFSPSLFTSDLNNRVLMQGIFNPVVLSEIVLPNGTSYKFSYNIYGEIDKVFYPTGGYERYEYDQVNTLAPLSFPYTEANRGVIKRWVSAKGDGSDETASPWQYSFGVTQSPDGTRTERDLYIGRRYGDPQFGQFGFDDARAGMMKEERVFNAAGTMLRRTLLQYDVAGPLSGGNGTATRDPRLLKKVEMLLDTNDGYALTKTTTYQYDQYLNVTSTTEYADDHSLATVTAQSAPLASIPTGTSLRTTETDYLITDANYQARNMLSLPTATRVRDGAGNLIAQSAVNYDEYDAAAYPLLTYPSVTGWSDPGTSARGNPTTVSHWLSTTNSYLSTHVQYDQCGSVRKSWDAKGNESQVDYTDSFSDATTRHTYAYPTSMTSPVPDPSGQHGLATALVATSVYDYHTGVVTSTTDANNVTSTLEYNDVLGRLTRTVRASGNTGVQSQTSISYDDANHLVTTSSDQTTFNDQALQSQMVYDGLGRTIEARAYEGATHYIATETQYDELGRAFRSSNPFRPWNAETPIWTTNTFDALGRVTAVTTPDGAQVTTAYSGNQVTVTDQAGKKRQSLTDALGRLAQVTEDPTTNGLNYQTSYGYDLLGNLLTVTQGDPQGAHQSRTFTYDSLSRLASATNPESGTINYHYDNNGNLEWKTDARGVKTNYAYDSLNRLKTRSYSLTGATPPNYVASPDVTYFYDGTGMPADVTTTPAFSKGKLTAVQSAVSNTIYTEFDAVGHITKHRQIVDPGTTVEQSYLMEYSYNLAGGLISEKYPSGRVIATEYDSAGRTAGVKNTASGLYYAGGAPDSSNRLQYTAHGAIKDMRLGNGLWEHTLFNSRLQPYEIGLGTAQGSIDRLKLTYTYSTTPTTSDNTGDVLSQTITVPTIGTATGYTATQSYTYDALNRLQSMSETGGLSQTFDYDRYGNRLITAGFVQDTAQVPHHLISTDPTISDWYDQNSNQLKTAKYDLAGNVIKDTAGTNPGHTFDYDGENKQTKYDGGATNGGTDYKYDGDGRRVKKVVGTGQATTIFVYDAMGQMVAEYSTISQQGSGGTSYLTADNLGTPRIITDSSGNVKARHDYLPFGEEISAGTGGRSATQGYAADNVNQKFTSKERDVETGLDYFGARYYSSVQGRFAGVDSIGVTKQHIINPQLWNAYTYALNNPLLMIDLDGKFPWTFYIRSFIYTSTAGAGLWRGDGRTPSTDIEGVTSRISLKFTFDYNKGQIEDVDIHSDPSVFLGVPGIIPPLVKTGHPDYVFSDGGDYGRSKSFGLHYWGNDPLPGFVTPDIDVHANITITENDNRGRLYVSGTFTGDKYPSTEAFIADQSGKKVFLGAIFEEGDIRDTYDDNKNPLFTVDMIIRFDKKGNFTAVMQGNKTYTIEAWNKKVQSEF